MLVLNEPTIDFNHKTFAKKGYEIYERKYKTDFEEKFKGMYAAIHVESEEAFVGRKRLDAYDAAIKAHPNEFFFFIRIGLPPIKRRGTRKISK